MVSRFSRDERWRDARVWLAVGIVLAILLFFGQAVFVQGVFFLGDTSHGYFPRLVYTANALRAGHMPLWNPLVSLGGPHIGDPAALALYPPAWILFLLLPAPVAYDYLILFHLALAALFMFLYMRRIGVGACGAIFSALLLPFSGWMLTHYEHINVFIGALYLPLLFWIVECAFQKTTWRWFVVSACALGFYFLGAHAQMPLFASVGLLLYAFGRALVARRSGWSWKNIAWSLALLAALGILGVGLAAIQLLPTAQAVALSNRSGGVGADVALGYSLPPEQIFTLFAPYLFGSPTGVAYWGRGAFREMTTYIGILPLAFAVVGIFRVRKNTFAFLLALIALVAWVLAMGRFTPLYGALASLPLFNSVRYPPRFLFLVSFALVALAGIGLERVLKARTSSRVVSAALVVGGILVALLVILNLLFIQHSFLNSILETLADLYGQAQHPVIFYLERLEFALSWNNLSGLALLGFLTASCLAVMLFAARKIPASGFVAGAIVLSVLDLWMFNFSLPYNRLTDPRLYTTPPANATILQQDTSDYRIYYFDHDDSASVREVQTKLQQGDYAPYIERLREGLRGSFNTLFNISSVTGYATEQQRHYEVMRALGGLPAYDLVGDDQYSDTLNLKLLSLLNGKYVTSLEDLNDVGLTLLHRGALVNLYRNENVLPRAFIPAQYEVLEPALVLQALTAANFEPRATVLLEQDPRLAQNSNARGRAEITHNAPEQVDVAVHMETPGILVLSDAYYPGWRVEVDGAPSEILRADYLLRGVALTQGVHTVRFTYVSDSFHYGALATAGSFGILLLIAAAGWRRAHKPTALPIEVGTKA